MQTLLYELLISIGFIIKALVLLRQQPAAAASCGTSEAAWGPSLAGIK